MISINSYNTVHNMTEHDVHPGFWMIVSFTSVVVRGNKSTLTPLQYRSNQLISVSTILND